MGNNQALTLYTALTHCLDDLLSGYHHRRSLAAHNGVTAGIYCFFACGGDLEVVDMVIQHRERVVSYICAMRDERVIESPYQRWHEATRKITDFLDERCYTEQPSTVLFADLVNMFDQWYEQEDYPELMVDNMLTFIKEDLEKRPFR